MKLLLFSLISLVIPKEDLRFKYVHEQGFDQSCGVSIASTLLDIYWNKQCSELDLLELLDSGDDEEYTVNLNDISKFITAYELFSKSYKMAFEELVAASVKYSPVIVHYDYPNKHFALFLGYKDGQIVTADPARGLEVLSVKEFEKRWSNMVMLVASNVEEKESKILEEAVDVNLKRKKILDRRAW